MKSHKTSKQTTRKDASSSHRAAAKETMRDRSPHPPRDARGPKGPRTARKAKEPAIPAQDEQDRAAIEEAERFIKGHRALFERLAKL